MTGPFPDRVAVPQGLVRPRLILGVPPLVWGALVVGTTLPPMLLGWVGWLATPITLALGAYLAFEARQDPDFLGTWAGELPLKRQYR
jgi:hypothetical protein